MKTFGAEMESQLRGLRERILARLAALEGAEFRRTPWERAGLGSGEMGELRGELFEKGGCNFSAVRGDRYPHVASEGMRTLDPGDSELGIRPAGAAELADKPFFATGVSLVMHPRNPFVPVVHMNVRYLEVGDLQWFGGGMDLTPCLPFDEDTAHFHETLRAACGAHDPRYYPRFSKWAREYFYIAHRKSERGVGGVFFDYLQGKHFWPFVQGLGDAFLPAYVPLVERRRETPWTDEQRAQQLRWRGRYVEFNLVYDRGTLFGLKTGGNPEAIFMSLPPLVSW